MSSPAEPQGRSGPIWLRPEPGTRRPAHSREKIARAAIEIADGEGWEAVSMRRIAASLGAGTMTIYHYVANKDELIALVTDAIMNEMVIPDEELPAGWRDGMAEIARRTLGVFQRHPWIVEHMGEGDPEKTGPGVLVHIEQTLAVSSRTGLDPVECFELASILDDYTFGHAMRLHTGSGIGDDDRKESMLRFLAERLDTGDYPHLADFAGDDPAAAFGRVGDAMLPDVRFERGLQRVLDGLELWVERARSGQS